LEKYNKSEADWEVGVYWSFKLYGKTNGDVVNDIASCRENTSFFAEIPLFHGTCQDIEENRSFLIVFDPTLDGLKFKKNIRWGNQTVEATDILVYQDPKLLIAPCDEEIRANKSEILKAKKEAADYRDIMINAKTPAAFSGAQEAYEKSLQNLHYWQEEDEECQEAKWLKKALLSIQKEKRGTDEFVALSIG
jgi:hypothetical protein